MRKLLVALGLAIAVLVVLAPPAHAGGWAVSSLDPMSPPSPGEEVAIGFTIRQHGATPVNVEQGEVGIVLRLPSGDEVFYPAAQQGPTGHYVADVTFPESGRYTWRVLQGWFGPQDLGTLDVGTASGAGSGPASRSASGSTAGSEYRWPLEVRVVVTVMALAAVALVAIEAVHARRARPPSTAPA